MFNRKEGTGDNITREEAQAYVSGIEQGGTRLRTEMQAARDDLALQIGELGDRVTTLETLAHSLRAGMGSETRIQAHQAPLPRRESTVPATATTVDYAAIAFGLSEIKRKVGQLVSGDGIGTSQMAGEYEGTVQYFADVFAKADPNFDEGAFKLQAGVNPPREPYVHPHHP